MTIQGVEILDWTSEEKQALRSRSRAWLKLESVEVRDMHLSVAKRIFHLHFPDFLSFEML